LETNDYLKNLTTSTDLSVLNRIREVRFSLDWIAIFVRFRQVSSPVFLRGLGKRFTLTSRSPELFTNSEAWAKLFKNRSYFHVGGDCYMIALTKKVRALANIDALLVVHDPLPKHIRRIEQHLGRMYGVSAFGLSVVEFTWDFLITRKKHRRRVQKLFKQTMYFSHGRVAFDQGNPPFVTDYINSRKSVKQSRVYPKPEVGGTRLELPINRVKGKQQGLFVPSHIFNYDLRLLDEIKFYTIDPYKVSRSLFDYNCDHYFSDMLAVMLSHDGFHQAQVWARKNKGCPNDCILRDSKHCKNLLNGKGGDNRKKRFEAIQMCPHAKPLVNFRRDFCTEIPELARVRKTMRAAFESWKKP
jgi:hypothetical protein